MDVPVKYIPAPFPARLPATATAVDRGKEVTGVRLRGHPGHSILEEIDLEMLFIKD